MSSAVQFDFSWFQLVGVRYTSHSIQFGKLWNLSGFHGQARQCPQTGGGCMHVHGTHVYITAQPLSLLLSVNPNRSQMLAVQPKATHSPAQSQEYSITVSPAPRLKGGSRRQKKEGTGLFCCWKVACTLVWCCCYWKAAAWDAQATVPVSGYP